MTGDRTERPWDPRRIIVESVLGVGSGGEWAVVFPIRSKHETKWDGRDDTGRVVPAGVYFYRIAIGDLVETKLMTLVK